MVTPAIPLQMWHTLTFDTKNLTWLRSGWNLHNHFPFNSLDRYLGSKCGLGKTHRILREDVIPFTGQRLVWLNVNIDIQITRATPCFSSRTMSSEGQCLPITDTGRYIDTHCFFSLCPTGAPTSTTLLCISLAPTLTPITHDYLLHHTKNTLYRPSYLSGTLTRSTCVFATPWFATSSPARFTFGKFPQCYLTLGATYHFLKGNFHIHLDIGTCSSASTSPIHATTE